MMSPRRKGLSLVPEVLASVKYFSLSMPQPLFFSVFSLLLLFLKPSLSISFEAWLSPQITPRVGFGSSILFIHYDVDVCVWFYTFSRASDKLGSQTFLLCQFVITQPTEPSTFRPLPLLGCSKDICMPHCFSLNLATI